MINTSDNQHDISWFRSRMGTLTGSEVSCLMKSGRKKDETFSDTAKAYLYTKAGERLFNPDFLADDEVFGDYLEETNVTTKAMRWGNEQEDAARRLAADILGYDIEEVSLCEHDTIPFFAASPDGILRNFDGDGRFGVLEIKCPNIGTYMKYCNLIHDAASLKEIKPEYYWQMMAEMDCTGAVGGVFVTYCPWLSTPFHYAAIERVEDDIKLMEERVALANTFIDRILSDIKQ